MKGQIAIGIDIGGSHITSAAVDLDMLEIIRDTTVTIKVDNKAKKDKVFENWAQAINKTIKSIPTQDKVKLGFAMPGPFRYKTGVARFKGQNDKYRGLYNVSVPDGLAKHIDARAVDMRFLNDATAFGVGVSATGKARNCSRIVAVTLGTGFGSAFIKDGVPQIVSEDVPKDGCLWDKPYKEGIGDDYFSTRWCINRYQELSSRQMKGVKEIANANDKYSRQVFKEFGLNMADFMMPFLKVYRPQLIVLGGNISLASDFFLPTFQAEVRKTGLEMDFEVSALMENAALIGSAKLFDSIFWEKVKENLPDF